MHAVSLLLSFFLSFIVSTYKPCGLNFLHRLLLVNTWLSDRNDRLMSLEKPSTFSYHFIGSVLLLHQSSCVKHQLDLFVHSLNGRLE
jgi:hypothetical protein